MQRLKATMFDNSVQVLNCDTKISASPNAGWCDGVISTTQQLPVVEVADCQFTSQSVISRNLNYVTLQIVAWTLQILLTFQKHSPRNVTAIELIAPLYIHVHCTTYMCMYMYVHPKNYMYMYIHVHLLCTPPDLRKVLAYLAAPCVRMWAASPVAAMIRSWFSSSWNDDVISLVGLSQMTIKLRNGTVDIIYFV